MFEGAIMVALKKNWALAFSLMLMFFVFIYIVIKGDNIHFTILDMLDSMFSDYKITIESGSFLDRNNIIPMLGGMNSIYLITWTKVYAWLFFFFSPLHAIEITWFLKIIVSIIGFKILAKEVFPTINNNIVTFCGFIFGLTPIAPPLAFCSATLPMLLAILAKIYKQEKKVWLYLALLLYPSFSSFVFFGIFICTYLLLFFIIDFISSRKAKWGMLWALLALSTGYILTEYTMFYSVLLGNDASIRQEILAADFDLADSLKEALIGFIDGQFHCASLHKVVVLPVCLCSLVYVFYRQMIKRDDVLYKDIYYKILCVIALNSLMFGLEKLGIFKSIIELLVPPLKGFDVSRAVWLNQFFWYLAFMIALSYLSFSLFRNILMICAFCAIVLGHTNYNFIRLNLGYELLSVIRDDDDYEEGYYSYGEFFSVKLFEKIKEDIDYQGEWSIAYGMYPAILNFNGISTLDGYSNYYSLEYKKKFERLIRPNEEQLESYEQNGRRAYVACSINGNDSLSQKHIDESYECTLDIDPIAFAEMGGKYIFSRVSVANKEELGLEEIGVFSDEESPYTIFVYRGKS